MRNLFICIVFLSLGLVSSAQETAKKIDEYISTSHTSWNIPGVAIAIVKDGKTVLSKGYGLRSSAGKEKVDAHTQFAIASNTKAFISAAIATLVEDGKLDWEDKVVDYLPYFKLYDPYVTAEFTITDLLCHRSGLGTFSGDLLWYGSDLSREQVIANAAYLDPVQGFREGYGYQNIMFMAAGEVIEEVTGMAWDAYVRQEFLDPLGMDETLSSTSELSSSSNHCAPHNEVDGKQVPINWVNWDNMGPAGSLISCVDDLSRWMLLQLGRGSLEDKEFWKSSHTDKMWTVHTAKELSAWHRGNFPSKHFSGYGLGWDLFDYHGRLVVNHGGGYDGFISQTILVPEEDLGFVILTNSNNFYPYAMMYHILDMYLAPDSAQDWGAYMLDLKKKGDARSAEEAKALLDSRVKNTKPSMALEAYVGEFHDPKYGSVQVTMEGGGLKFDFEPTSLYYGKLEHWHYDTFNMVWGEQHFLPEGKATFIINEKGQVEELRVRCPNPDLFFYELELIRVADEPGEH